MPVPSITPLPAAPQRTDPSNFPGQGDAWVAALTSLFVGQMNAAIAAINAGGFPTHRVALTGAYTAVQADNGTIFDCSGTFTLAFTAAATLAADWWCIVANRGTGNVTLDPSSAETVDGQATGVIYPGFVMLLHCDGTGLRAFKLSGYRQELLTSGTSWTCPIGIRQLTVTTQGAGASGRRSTTHGAAGGAGGTAIKNAFPTPGTAYTCAIGAGGNAVTADSTNGNAGGDTTFTINGVTVTGSGAPAVSAGDAIGANSAGGAASNGDVNIPGGAGVVTNNVSNGPSIGGDSMFGRGGVNNLTAQRAAGGYGSGGYGSQNGSNSGAGMPGCIVLEY